jgi:hypothetical protein
LIRQRQLGSPSLELERSSSLSVISTADAIASEIRRQRYDSFTDQEGTCGGQH